MTTPSPGTTGPDKASVEVAVRAGNSMAAKNDAAMQSFVGVLTERAQTTDEDQYSIMAQVTAEIMAADNMAELMSERASLHARDVVGVPMLLHGFEIREGTFEDGILPFYAAMTCGRPDSEHTRIVTCGGMKVLAKLIRMDQIINTEGSPEGYPQVFWFTEKRTSNGFSVLDIVRP